jgi:hypothetical protein
MTDEKKIEPELKDELWDNLAAHFYIAVQSIVESRKPVAEKRETLAGIVKLAYQSGLDRGYDMGHKVFGDGE